jgi:hypothetical protein
MEASDLLMLLARISQGLGDRGLGGYEIPAERLGALLGEDEEPGPATGDRRAQQVAAVAEAVGGEVG